MFPSCISETVSEYKKCADSGIFSEKTLRRVSFLSNVSPLFIKLSQRPLACNIPLFIAS